MVHLRLLKFTHDEFVTPLKHKTGAIEREYIDGYPKQLWIYHQAASPFWWVRSCTNGQQLKKTTKTADSVQFFWPVCGSKLDPASAHKC